MRCFPDPTWIACGAEAPAAILLFKQPGRPLSTAVCCLGVSGRESLHGSLIPGTGRTRLRRPAGSSQALANKFAPPFGTILRPLSRAVLPVVVLGWFCFVIPFVLSP